MNSQTLQESVILQQLFKDREDFQKLLEAVEVLKFVQNQECFILKN